MKIAIAGTGYVGLSNAILLAQYNEVVSLDIAPEKVTMRSRKEIPIEDAEIEDCLTNKKLNFPPRWTKLTPTLCTNRRSRKQSSFTPEYDLAQFKQQPMSLSPTALLSISVTLRTKSIAVICFERIKGD